MIDMHNETVLFSPDGQQWRTFESGSDGPLSKVVIGSLEGAPAALAPALRTYIEARWSTITHLHIWNISGLTVLPALPERLQCLDLRRCGELTTIPPLPDTVETLDLGQCAGLEALPGMSARTLRWLHLDGCTGVPSYVINTLIAGCTDLEELTLADCEQLVSLEALRTSRPFLRKLVLSGCTSLTALPDLVVHPLLSHINLNGCSALARLPDVPVSPTPAARDGLQYLVVHTCDALREYRGLDLRTVHRSIDADDNIVDTIRAFRYLGEPPVQLLCSKLLLLGSGRVGKTTLAKALRWASLSSAERDTDTGRALDPVQGSTSTEGIGFWQWPGYFRMPGTKDDQPGTVHIWDFGGQQIYHNTHRLFAAEGSVFVVVCTDRATHAARLKKEIDASRLSGADLEEFNTENQYREVRYWLDYVRNALGLSMDEIHRLPVVVLHAGTSTDTRYIVQQAGPYEPSFNNGAIPIHRLDCSGPQYVESSDFRGLRNALATALGQSADALGTRVPLFYKALHDWVERKLPAVALMAQPCPSFSDWCRDVEADLGGAFPLAFALSAVPAVTRYLHRIGRVFWLNEPGNDGAILLDQHLGADAIYSLHRRETRQVIRQANGVFTRDWLSHPLSGSRAKAIGIDRFVGLLERCGICATISPGRYQALESELLPELTNAVEEACRTEWYAACGPDHVNHCFRLFGKDGMMVGTADYQAVAAWAARAAGTGHLSRLLMPEREENDRHPVHYRDREWASPSMRFWRHGFQIALTPPTDEGLKPTVLRVGFNVKEQSGFEGSLYVELLTAYEDAVADRVRKALIAQDGPLYTIGERLTEDDHRPVDLERDRLGHLRDAAMWPWKDPAAPPDYRLRHDVAISFRGVDLEIARRLHQALESAGVDSYYFSDDRRLKLRDDDRESTIHEIYDYLDRATCLIIVASESYFDLRDVSPRRGNVYCPVELAAAVNSVARTTNPRPAEYVVLFAKITKGFNWASLDETATGTLKTFQDEIAKRTRVSELDDYEDVQVRQANRALQPFLNGCGRGAKQGVRYDADKPETLDDAIKEAVSKVKTALGKP